MDNTRSANVSRAEYAEHVNYNLKEYPAYIRKDFLSYYPNYSAISHWHGDLEFIVVLSGSITFQVNGQNFPIESGNGIMVNSRQVHRGYSPEHRECEFICILLHPLLLCVNDYFAKRYVNPIINNSSQPCLLLLQEIPWQKQVMDTLKAIYQCSIQNFDALLIQQLAFSLWYPLYHNCPHARGTPAKANRQLIAVKKMVTFIQEHYKETITLDQIAASGNVCKSSCSSLFHKYLSRSPIAYLTEYRLDQSLELLLHTDLSVTEISFETGFHNASYFAETFKKYYHCTPSGAAKQKWKN